MAISNENDYRDSGGAVEYPSVSFLTFSWSVDMQIIFPIQKFQNSMRIWNAIIRGVLSPPKPTPSKPVGGEVA
jgi:hypothetical protein